MDHLYGVSYIDDKSYIMVIISMIKIITCSIGWFLLEHHRALMFLKVEKTPATEKRYGREDEDHRIF